MRHTVPGPTDNPGDPRRVGGMSHPTTRWIAETGGTRGAVYAERIRRLHAAGGAVHGEADALGALVPTPARVLDAGCGTGRVAVELARRGYDVTGLDVDASMLAEAERDAASAGVDVRWVLGDLLDAPALAGDGYDLVAAPGNVVVYLAPGTEERAVAALATVLRPGGLLVVGFAADRHVTEADYAAWCAASGLTAVHRWGGWDGEVGDGSYVVAVDRR
ncbi:class I SAM-dependent methyltransferase [Angustibacter aerolatus]